MIIQSGEDTRKPLHSTKMDSPVAQFVVQKCNVSLFQTDFKMEKTINYYSPVEGKMGKE